MTIGAGPDHTATLIWPKSDGTYEYGMYCPNKGTQNKITQTP